MKKLFSSKKNEKGQGLVEYAIILALVAIVVIGVMTTLGKKVCNTMDGVSNSLDGGSGSNCGSTAAAVPPAVIEGDAARTQYCAERPGWVGGVNWGFAGGHTWTTAGQTYHVTGDPFNCPY